jgi:hypothetical protein
LKSARHGKPVVAIHLGVGHSPQPQFTSDALQNHDY